jgi:hypothetical protein
VDAFRTLRPETRSADLELNIPDRRGSWRSLDDPGYARYMSKWLQEWMRRMLLDARWHQPVDERERKLRAVRKAAKFAFPTADMERMLSEIEEGYKIDLHRL